MTHNAFSNANAPPLPGVERITFYNQEDTITNQLQVISLLPTLLFWIPVSLVKTLECVFYFIFSRMELEG